MLTLLLIIGLLLPIGCNNFKDLTGVEIHKLIKEDEEARADHQEKEESSTSGEYEAENTIHISGGKTEYDNNFHISGNES